MKKILIHNDNGKQDLLGLRLLEEALTSNGFKVVFTGRTALKARLRRIQPDALIMTNCDDPVGELASAVCPVYVLPGEGGRITEETTLAVLLGIGNSGARPANWVRRYYLWSETTKKSFLDSGVINPSQVKVMGNARLDIYKRRTYKELFKKRADDAPLRIGIAYSSTSTSQCFGPPHYAAAYHDHVTKDYVCSIIPPGRHFEDVIWRDHTIMRHMMQVVKDIGENTNFEMIFHPNSLEGSSEYRFLEKKYPGRFRTILKESLPEFISNIDVLLTCWSTTGIEALINGIPVISINSLINQKRLFDHIAQEQSGFNTYVTQYHNPETPADLMELLELANANQLAPSPKAPEETVSMLEEVYGWVAGGPSSCVLIAKDISDDLSSLDLQSTHEISWRRALPLRYNLPPVLSEIGSYLKEIIRATRSGEFRSYMSFLSLKDPSATRLLRRVR